VEFEPTIPAFERAKTVHALDRSDTVTGPKNVMLGNISSSRIWIMYEWKTIYFKESQNEYKLVQLFMYF
jgi:hypothetical protein